jgi:hypothetical protein
MKTKTPSPSYLVQLLGIMHSLPNLTNNMCKKWCKSLCSNMLQCILCWARYKTALVLGVLCLFLLGVTSLALGQDSLSPDVNSSPTGYPHTCTNSSAIPVRLDLIAQIESSGNPGAINKADNAGIGSYGLYQLSPYVVADFNKRHKTSYNAKINALEPITASLIADWYLHKEIPRLLKHFKKPVTLENVLTSYNMGVGAVLKGRVAKAYIAKYKGLL